MDATFYLNKKNIGVIVKHGFIFLLKLKTQAVFQQNSSKIAKKLKKSEIFSNLQAT